MRTLLLLIVFLCTLITYLVYVNLRKGKDKQAEESTTTNSTPVADQPTTEDSECCGQHAVCEKETLINTKLVADYYDDEELDQFKGKEADSYDSSEIKLFEDILYTMKEYDVSGWLKSLQIRGITPPERIMEEALLIVKERRFNK